MSSAPTIVVAVEVVVVSTNTIVKHAIVGMCLPSRTWYDTSPTRVLNKIFHAMQFVHINPTQSCASILQTSSLQQLAVQHSLCQAQPCLHSSYVPGCDDQPGHRQWCRTLVSYGITSCESFSSACQVCSVNLYQDLLDQVTPTVNIICR